MLKYIIIQLADNAVSFCNYEHNDSATIIDLTALKNAIFWAMKENLNVQLLYPNEELPQEYKKIIDSIDHSTIISSECKDLLLIDSADVIVFDSWKSVNNLTFKKDKSYIVRTTKEKLFDNTHLLSNILRDIDRLIVVITDIHCFTDKDFIQYEQTLDSLIPNIVTEYSKEHFVHFNLLSDRIFLNQMNNCNAGFECITVAPNGKFYICPAFYFSDNKSVGDPESGLKIQNQQLYRIDHAPICRICDAYQCRRCVWHNRIKTLEVNTPSHEQCVVAHIERNAAKKLSDELHNKGIIVSQSKISNVDYLDPFDNLINT